MISRGEDPRDALSGCAMRAMIRSVPPQRTQASISMPNICFSRFAQFITKCRGVGG